MDLNTLWFILIAVLFVGFFFLEGFDYGVGMLLPFLGKNDAERRVIINSIGPVWDGNEVWMITAGGASFAAFPHFYATLFSGAYLALTLMLLALITRAVSFEYRSKVESPVWRGRWDWVIFTCSLVPALLWGVAMAALLYGTPIDAHMNFTGGFFSLLSAYSISGGLLFVAIFAFHGATFLALKTAGELSHRAESAAKGLWPIGLVVFLVYAALALTTTDLLAHAGAVVVILLAIAAVTYILARVFLARGRQGWTFVMSALTIVFAVITLFAGLFPRLMVSSLNPEWSLTIYNASASHYTLKTMSIVVAIFLPFVLAYQAWTYWIFRKRLTVDSKMEY
ncbi:MAG: cytochrome d ubiquinol oxidase subunit II [Acidobacteria bacterium]|nr:cytochrome d ubiquinol oxidase subunit II [Acidobacteriota bacterium]